MINGAHVIIYSANADADRMFLRDVLGLPHVDVGRGWLIFGLPPSEVAVHSTAGAGGTHELYLMCSDVEALRSQLAARGIQSAAVEDQGWGLVTQVRLPGGSQIGVYEPRHARPAPAAASAADAKRKGRGAAKKVVKGKGGVKKAAPAAKKAATKKAATKSAATKKAGKRRRA